MTAKIINLNKRDNYRDNEYQESNVNRISSDKKINYYELIGDSH